jgi:hemoglobin
MKILTSLVALLFLFSCTTETECKAKSEVKADCKAKSEVKASTESLYTQIGGQKAVDAAVDLFYTKVLADKRVNHFFEDVNMKRQIKRQKQFLGSALGGPIKYEGKTMEKAHKGMNLTPMHFGAIAGHLLATLNELKIDPKITSQVMTLVGSLKGKIINK